MSRRNYGRLTLAVVCLLILGACQRGVDRSRVYRIGIRNLQSTDGGASEGRVDTFAVEVASEAGRRANVQLKWVVSPEGPDEALSAGRVDMWPTFTILPERGRRFHLTDPWMSSERALLTQGPPRREWQGAKVAYGLGPVSSLLEQLPGAVAVHKQGEVAAIQSVCIGEVDAAFVLVQSFGSLLVRRPEGCGSVTFRITPLRETQLKVAIGATKEMAPVADALREQIGRMAADGTLAQLFNKYSMYSSSESEIVYQLADAQRRSRLSEYGAGGLAVATAILIWQMKRVREARRTADQANRAKSEFLAHMSHEIRTPLNGIIATAEMLARRKLEEDERSLVDLIQGSSEGLLTLVNEILDFSRIEAGGLQMELVRFDLYEVVSKAVKLLQPQAAGKNLTLESAIRPEVPRWVVTDPMRLRQVLLNLLSNAVKFTEKGKVRLEVLPAGDPNEQLAVLFRVIDTGIGIDEMTLQKLFNPFTQGDSSTNRKYGGTGLGLAVCRRLVSLLGGTIGVESHPGKGSAFWFLLPVDAAEAEIPPQQVEPAPACEPKPEVAGAAAPEERGHVLIVDDNPVNQIVAARAVRSLGYSASVVSNGQAALDALQQEHIDLVLLDCQMPELDGYQTAAEVRKRESRTTLALRHTPIVAMTANAIDGEMERCVAAGMDDYVAKPFRMATLESTLARWIPAGITLCPANSAGALPTLPGQPSDRPPTPLPAPLPRA